MFIEQSNALIRKIWRATWRIKTSERIVYLTFDDGPCPDTTPQVLDLLDRYGIQATFFCVGDNVRKYPKLFAQLRQRGHGVGNHTMHHLKGFNTEYEKYLSDISDANTLIKSGLMRPPYGRITQRQLRTLRTQYSVVMWDVITRDYNPKLSPERIMHIVQHYTRCGSIIVFHDSLKAAHNMLTALPQAIEWLQQQGYKFEVLNEDLCRQNLS